MSGTYSLPEGPWEVKKLVNDYLKWDLPRRIQIFRDHWNLDDALLPIPEKYHAYEPPALDHWPMIITLQLAMSRAERIDYMSGLNAVYRCTYNMRTYVWVRGESPEEAVESRDRLTTVVRSALLDHACLGLGLSHATDQILLDEGTLREEYSDVTYVSGNRVVAGAYLSYNINLDEAMIRADISEVTEIQVQYDGGSAELPDIAENVFTQIIIE